MRFQTGLRLGPYEVLSLLGAGGMAEVYRARDTRLARDVALKVVNESLSADPELLRRFEHEARLAGSLNHPNLVAVYDFGLHEGVPFFVTELLKGESLRARLARGPLATRTALDWAIQMALGLAAAHAQGVVHRDVKPDNVFISSDGHVKLLDFGIAKLAEAARDGGPHGLMDVTTTPTGGATQTGSVLGTPGYMSPEQVRGESVDARTDIFSLGAVVYEMVSGKRAFPGATVFESGSAILRDEPEPLPEGVPAPVAQTIRRCLEKDREQRFQSARDVGFALDAVRTASGALPSMGPEPTRHGRRRLALSAVAAAGVLAAVVAVFVAGQHREVTSQALPGIEAVTFRWGTIGAARFLLDGRVAFSAAFEGRPEELFVRPSGSPTPQALGVQDAHLLATSGTGDLAVLLHPRVSISAYWTTQQGTLATVPSVGGTPREMAEKVEYADWSPGGGLAVVRQSGAERILEFPPGRTLFRTRGWITDPRFSRSGDRIAFLHHPIVSASDAEVVVTDLQGQTRILSQRWSVAFGLAWSADGTELWFTRGTGEVYSGERQNILAAVSLAGKARELTRSFSGIRLEDVGKHGEVLLTNWLARVELVYAGDGSAAQSLLSWTDWNWTVQALSAEGKVLFSAPRTAPNSTGEYPNLVMLRTKDGAPPQVLGEGAALDLSRDGRWALALAPDGKIEALPTGVGTARTIASDGLEIAIRAGRWMRDGKGVLAIGRAPGEDHAFLYRLETGASAPVRVSDAPLSMRARLQISPDGRWAATVNEDWQLVVVSLQDGGLHSIPSMVTEPAIPRGWSPDGSLWITELARSHGTLTRLLRLDLRTGKLLEERNIGPADPGGATAPFDVVLSPDGRNVAFTYIRDVGSLVIVRGLGRAGD